MEDFKLKDYEIDRINELAKKKKAEGLTEEEQAEQKKLYKKYIGGVKGNLTSHIESIVIEDEKGNRRKVTKKPKK